MSKQAFAAYILEGTRIGALLRRFNTWRGVLVLAYHRIGDGSKSCYDRALFSATSDDFDAQVRYLKKCFDIVGPDDLGAVSAKSRGRYVLITFDDGYRDNYDHAFPILKSYGVGATFFISTGFIDRPRCPWWDEIAWMVRRSPRSGLPVGRWLPAPVAFDEPERVRAVRAVLRRYKSLPGQEAEPYLDFLAEATGSGRFDGADATEAWMSWDMLREMKAGGMWIGGHTVSHPVLAQLARPEQDREIAGCAKRIAQELCEPMRYFSYPVGGPDSFNDHTRACLKAHAVELAFSYYGGYRGFHDWDPYDIRRYRMEPEVDLAWLHACVTLPQIFA